MVESERPERWEYKQYKLISIQPTSDYFFVYVGEDDDGEYMTKSKCDAIGVAEVTWTRRERVGEYGYKTIEGPEYFNEVVGLSLSEGDFEIVNEFDNFAGLCKEGDDICRVTFYMNNDYRNRLGDNPRVKEST